MSQTTIQQDAPKARPAPPRYSLAWLGVMPFFLFSFLFLLYPSSTIIVRTFKDSETGQFTFQNVLNLLQNPYVLGAYWLSIKISVVTAVGGGIFGFLLAYSSIRGGLPRYTRSGLMTFSGVASNFAGIPLAFAFIALLSPTGMLTNWLRIPGLNIYDYGFTLYKFWGLCVVYLYFQFPLMVLIITPAIDGLRREWVEASDNLGASTFQYWRYVAFPILLPSIMGSMILLFGNAFGAYATAVALTGGSSMNLATIVIGAELRGDVLGDPGLGYAVAFGMVVVMTVVMIGYTILQRRAERWLK